MFSQFFRRCSTSAGPEETPARGFSGSCAARRGLDGRKQGCLTEGTLVLRAIYEKCRRVNDARRTPPPAGSDLCPVRVLPHLLSELPQVQPDIRRVPRQAQLVQHARVLEHGVVHLPEFSLGRCALRRLGGLIGVLESLRLREGAEDVTDLGTQFLLDRLDPSVCLCAFRTREISVAEESDLRERRSSDVVRRRPVRQRLVF